MGYRMDLSRHGAKNAGFPRLSRALPIFITAIDPGKARSALVPGYSPLPLRGSGSKFTRCVLEILIDCAMYLLLFGLMRRLNDLTLSFLFFERMLQLLKCQVAGGCSQ